jgi:stage V sporulation protein B
MEKAKSKKQSFMAGVFTIMFAQITIKLLGFVYRHVLTLIPEFGDEGNGLYGIGFNIYMLLLTVATVGVPGAISKLVSKYVAKGEVKKAKHIFKIAMILFTCVGIAGTAVMLVSAKSVATLAGNEAASGVLMALAPSVVFVAIASVIRGYFNGLYNMKPSSFNQTLEQFFKALLSIAFVCAIHYLFNNQADVALRFGISKENVTAVMAVWANIASTISTAIGLLYLVIYYKFHKKDINDIVKTENNDTKEDDVLPTIKHTIKMILSLSIPMSLASIVSAVNRNIDSFTVNNILQQVLPFIKPEIAGNSELIVAEATRLYGILAGKVDMLIGLPLSINIAFATAIVPAVTEAITKGNKELASKRIAYSIRLSMLIALPCSIGLCLFAEPILELLFHGQVATSPESILLLQISSFTILFTVMNQTINASLQGIGKLFIPALALLIGVIIKLILNLVLIRIPSINVYGAAIGSVVCHLIATIIVTKVLFKNIELKIRFRDVVVKPVVATVIMGVISLGVYALLTHFLGTSRIATLISLIIAIATYGLSVVKLNILSKDDYLLLPAGDKIYSILNHVKLVK